jgi:methyl-accepting chemotaxis protein
MINELTLKTIKETSLEIVRNISTISAKSETDFLKIGEILARGNVAGGDIVRIAHQCVELAGGESGKKSLIEIQSLIQWSLKELLENRKKIVAKSDSVKRVVGRLGELESKNADIEMIAKHLRAVALNIFIETARSNTASENFSIIAHEIKDLSGDILNLSDTIRENVKASRKRFAILYKEISLGLEKLEKLSVEAEKTVQDAIKKADDIINQAFEIAVYTRDMGPVLEKEVSKIVLGLQFHDSMRQRLEHVASGLGDMERLCSETVDTPITEAPGVVYAIADILCEQLQMLIDEAAKVRLQNKDSFEKLDKGISHVANGVQRLAGVGGVGGKDSVFKKDSTRMLNDALKDFITLKSQGGELVERIDKTYVMAAETTEALTEQIGKIHTISMDAHIKAMNAIIAAIHLGEDGRTLSVLAGEMKQLSELADVFVVDVGKIITTAVSEITVAKEDIGIVTEEDESNRERLMTLLGGLPELYEQMKDKAIELQSVMETMHDIHESAKQGMVFISQMIDGLSLQHRSLDTLKNMFSAYAGDETALIKAGEMMGHRYTMEKERTVIRGLSVEPAGDMGQDDSDLGDNVELF